MTHLYGSPKMLFDSEAAAIAFLSSQSNSISSKNPVLENKITGDGYTGLDIIFIGGGIILTGVLIYYTLRYIE